MRAAGRSRRTRCTTRAPSPPTCGARSSPTRCGGRFAEGRAAKAHWYASAAARLAAVGFAAAITDELRAAAEALAEYAAAATR
jgi:hypothetical protein